MADNLCMTDPTLVRRVPLYEAAGDALTDSGHASGPTVPLIVDAVLDEVRGWLIADAGRLPMLAAPDMAHTCDCPECARWVEVVRAWLLDECR